MWSPSFQNAFFNFGFSDFISKIHFVVLSLLPVIFLPISGSLGIHSPPSSRWWEKDPPTRQSLEITQRLKQTASSKGNASFLIEEITVLLVSHQLLGPLRT